MRKILLLLLVCCANLAFAQEIAVDTTESREAVPLDEEAYKDEFQSGKFHLKWGLRGGISKTRINTSSGDVIQITANGIPMVTENGIVRDQMVSNTAFGSGFQAAAFVRFIKGSFYIQPELVYGSKGGKFDLLDESGALLNRVDAKFSAIDIPILLGLRFRDARIFGGPVISYALQKNKEFDNALKPYTNENLSKDFFNRPTVNAVLGLGFEFKSLTFGLRYEGGIANYGQTTIGPKNNPKSFDFTTDQFIFSIGFIK